MRFDASRENAPSIFDIRMTVSDLRSSGSISGLSSSAPHSAQRMGPVVPLLDPEQHVGDFRNAIAVGERLCKANERGRCLEAELETPSMA